MIIKIHKAGRSFKGVTRYLAHDVKAETTERVAWTHTLNLAHDEVPSAVDEMLWTFRSADMLKREAGVGTGGKKLENPVKHFSLAWAPDESPTKEHMVETVRAYMEHMGWHDHQAVLISHNDRRHAHVHVVMNSVGPLDGRAARDSHDWRRTEAFALQYERERGRIYCEQRLKPREQRDATPTRESWQRFRPSEIAFERAEVARLTKTPDYFERYDAKATNQQEWTALKAWQRQQREQFFMDGKEAFREVRKEAFREVREEFRAQWNAYYAAKRHGDDPLALAATKAALLEAQRKALDERRAKACDELREQRDRAYQAVLEQQRIDRAELGRRQEQGLRTYQLFDVIYPVPEPATPVSRTKSGERWQAHGAGLAERADMDATFEHSARGSIDPHAGAKQYARDTPGVLRRDNVAPAAEAEANGFGRHRRDAEKTPERAKHEIVPGTLRGGEMTEAASEKARVQRARERTDQMAAKREVGEAAALRASWNRRRGRGGWD